MLRSWSCIRFIAVMPMWPGRTSIPERQSSCTWPMKMTLKIAATLSETLIGTRYEMPE
jgi:hypothetical protein